MSRLLILARMVPVLVLAGCGPSMADVRGKLVYNGKPVTAGSILFSPRADPEQLEAGKPATGAPDENGEFRLTTFRENDGALVATHSVYYYAPLPQRSVDKELVAKSAAIHKEFGGLKLPQDYTVELKPGRNDIVLELKK